MPAYHSGRLSKTDRPHYNYPLRPMTKDLTVPLAPKNLFITSPYIEGKTDIRWDNPTIIPENNGLNIIGVNVYRATDSPEATYIKLNSTPVGAMYYRDETKETETIEDATATLKIHEADNRWLVYAQHRPIIKYGTNGETSFRPEDVKVEIDDGDGQFLEVPAFSVNGRTGEITLISAPTFNYNVDQPIPPRLPTPPDGKVRITYRYLQHHVLSALSQRIYYKVTTVAEDPDNPGHHIETPIDEVSARSTFDMEAIDWVWREAIRRNRWILEQQGERVKLFIRKWMGESCPLHEYEYGQSYHDCETCFPAGQLVTMQDGSPKRIETVVEGEKVLTLDGTVQEVTETFVREYNGLLHSINCTGKDPILCTSEHPFLVIRSEDAWCKRWGNRRNKCVPMKKKYCMKGYHTNATDCTYRPSPTWVKARELKEGDYLLVPRIKTEEGDLSNSLLFLLGFYTAEGCVSLNGNRSSENRLRFGIGEQWLVDLVKQTFLEEFNEELRECSASDSEMKELWICNKEIADIFLKHCGKYAHGKRLSSEIIKSSKEGLAAFMSGYIMGDGHVSSNVQHLGAIYFSTVSEFLASQLEIICAKIGISVSVHLHYHDDPRGEEKSGYIYKAKISSLGAQKIPLYGRKNIQREIKKGQKKILVHNDWIAYPIFSIGINRVSLKVFNLEISNNNTYLVNNCVAHNCYGTNYIGGYEGPYDIIIAPPETEKSIELADMGLHIRYDWTTWTGDYPLLNERDVIVRQNNERYIVGPVNPQGSRGAIYQQHFTISHIDIDDIRYKIGITGGETSVPASSDIFREERKSPASPVINRKPEIPEPRIIRGRTVTFENITW